MALRSSALTLLCPLALTACGAGGTNGTGTGTGGNTAPPPPPAVPISSLEGAWSNPATWGGTLPGPDSGVTIPAGKTVTLDAQVSVRNITVMGTLLCADKDLKIAANWVMVHAPGKLECGTAARPFTKRLEIVLNAKDETENVMGMGTKFLGAMGGTIELQGLAKTSWTKLSATVAPGATQLQVLEANNWRVGDRIVIAPTDFDPLEAEERTVRAVNGTGLTLDRPLEHQHWGRVQTLTGTGETMDQRAEVANLTRNITVRGENAAGSTFGGHVMFMQASTARLSNVEVTGMGQLGKLGRYPMHWHLVGDGGKGSYLKDSSVHGNFQRGVVIHRTNDLEVSRNTVYNTVGHMIFLESATEVRNTLEGNLALLTRPIPLDKRNPELEFEHAKDRFSDSRVSGFWISNSHNRIVGNTAAGVVHGIGYWFAEGAFSGRRDKDMCRDEVMNADGSCHLNFSDRYFQIRADSPLLAFQGNTAHSIRSDDAWGETLHTSAVAVGLFLEFNSFAQDTVPVARDFRAWKISNAAVWPTEFVNLGIPQLRRTPVVENLVVADSRSAVFAAEKVGPIGVRGGVFYGMTDNQPPGVNAASRDYARLFKSYGAHNDDLEVTVLSLYPTILESSNKVTESQARSQLRLDGSNEPRFTEFSSVRIQGWPK